MVMDTRVFNIRLSDNLLARCWNLRCSTPLQLGSGPETFVLVCVHPLSSRSDFRALYAWSFDSSHVPHFSFGLPRLLCLIQFLAPDAFGPDRPCADRAFGSIPISALFLCSFSITSVWFLTAAKQGLDRALQLTWGKNSEVTTYCLEKLGDIKQWSSAVYQTYIWPIALLVHAWKTKQRLGMYKALQFLGDFFLVEGNQNTAISLFTIALDAFTYMDIHRSRAECMLQLGDISMMNGDFGKAEELWKLARPLFERASQKKKVALIDKKLLIRPDWHKLQQLTVGLNADQDRMMDHNLITGKEVEDLALPLKYEDVV
ncbi:hypothetical protein GGX14DRAFT_674124 [Mycena pura]|uniref:Uncharacterized protein n=1 Tax=Mycena pura TaxID=153505 RepID=A0AAD6UVV1_9AGAR|nr:hypothetical protein GGX14DRAFT_674124 [Mycena pura]